MLQIRYFKYANLKWENTIYFLPVLVKIKLQSTDGLSQPFPPGTCKMLNSFVNLSKNGNTQQDLKPHRIKQDLIDAPSVIDLFKFGFMNSAEKSSLISWSSTMVPNEALRIYLEDLYKEKNSHGYLSLIAIWWARPNLSTQFGSHPLPPLKGGT